MTEQLRKEAEERYPYTEERKLQDARRMAYLAGRTASLEKEREKAEGFARWIVDEDWRYCFQLWHSSKTYDPQQNKLTFSKLYDLYLKHLEDKK